MISVHACPLAPLGGWETGGLNVYLRELSRALAARGVTVDIFTRRQGRERPAVSALAPGARVVHLDAGPARHVDKYEVLDYLPEFACNLQRFRALDGARYDLIHAHYWLSGRVAAIFKEVWGVPLVASFHTLGELKGRAALSPDEREEAVRTSIEARLMAQADRIVAATAVDREQMVRFYGAAPQKIRIVPGGVDLDRFRPLERGPARQAFGIDAADPVLLFVGRIQPLKGVEVLLRAAALLAAELPRLRVLVVGGLGDGRGPEARELRRLHGIAAALGIADRVAWLGAVEQARLPALYAAADVTVMPSAYESFGLVAVESLACGTPVVATRVGGLATIVQDGTNGLLVPWRDPALFADRIRTILTDDALRQAMCARAPLTVRRYGWPGIAAAMHGLYAELVAAPASLPARR
jgi:D-inositol-3-phosphate glycosyltransferase